MGLTPILCMKISQITMEQWKSMRLMLVGKKKVDIFWKIGCLWPTPGRALGALPPCNCYDSPTDGLRCKIKIYADDFSFQPSSQRSLLDYFTPKTKKGPKSKATKKLSPKARNANKANTSDSPVGKSPQHQSKATPVCPIEDDDYLPDIVIDKGKLTFTL